MKTLGKALEARSFLLAITILLCAMVGTMYSLKSGLDAATPSAADLQQAMRGQQGIRTLVPGSLGESIAKALAAADESRLASAEFASKTRTLLSCLAVLGLLGCLINIPPWIRRRVFGAVQPGAASDGPSTRALTP